MTTELRLRPYTSLRHLALQSVAPTVEVPLLHKLFEMTISGRP
jgi:hypothetical protein